jgi:hypothetical protein
VFVASAVLPLATVQGPAGPPGDVFAADDSADLIVTPLPPVLSRVQASLSAYTVPSNVLTAVPGVSLPLLPNRTYVFEFSGEMSSNNGLGATINFACSYSGASTRFLQAGRLPTGNTSIANTVNNTNGGEMTASVGALVTGNWPFQIFGTIDTTSAGNLTLQVRRDNATVNIQLQAWVSVANA